MTRPPVAYSLGLLAMMLDRSDVDGYFALALDFSKRIQAPLFAAMTQVEWGASRLERGDSDRNEACVLVDNGLATAMAAGAGAIERRARRS